MSNFTDINVWEAAGLWNMNYHFVKISIHEQMEIPGPRIRAKRAELERAKSMQPPAPALPSPGLVFMIYILSKDIFKIIIDLVHTWIHPRQFSLLFDHQHYIMYMHKK